MGGSWGSISSTFQSTERPTGFLMRATFTIGLPGRLYEATSMLRMEGKGVGGRGGYKSVPFIVRKGRKEKWWIWVANNQVSCYFVVLVWVCNTCLVFVWLGLLLWSLERCSTFTFTAFSSNDCFESSTVGRFSASWSVSFLINMWVPYISVSN